MKYKGKDLVEITTSQIIKPPREMLVWNGDMAKRNKAPQKETVYAVVKIGIRYVAITSSYKWEFCAEIPEESTPRRATNRELARWCAQGNGENTDGCWVYHVHCYPKAAENNEVSESIVVRKWNDAGWHEPTVDYMEIEKSSSDSNVLMDSKMHAVDMPKYLEAHFNHVKIGNQTWMSENLAVTDGGDGIYRNKDNDEYYYTWEAAKRIADKIPGWHLPSGAEWDELVKTTGNDAANLRAKSWDGAREGSWFAAVPAGHWYNGFINVGSVAYFWTFEPEGMNSVWYRGIDAGTTVYKEVASHWVGLSVRLVKDK